MRTANQTRNRWIRHSSSHTYITITIITQANTIMETLTYLKFSTSFSGTPFASTSSVDSQYLLPSGVITMGCESVKREREGERERYRRKVIHPIIFPIDTTNMYCVSRIQLKCTGYKYLTLQISPQLISLIFQQPTASMQIISHTKLHSPLTMDVSMYGLQNTRYQIFTRIYVGSHPKACQLQVLLQALTKY